MSSQTDVLTRPNVLENNCMKMLGKLSVNYFTVCVHLSSIYDSKLLTRSSSAVRLGVRMGACGRLGSLPRLGGRGSRGSPLHMSFREDILHSVACHTLDEQRAWRHSSDRETERHCASIFKILRAATVCPTPRLAFWLSLPFRINQWKGAGR